MTAESPELGDRCFNCMFVPASERSSKSKVPGFFCRTEAFCGELREILIFQGAFLPPFVRPAKIRAELRSRKRTTCGTDFWASLPKNNNKLFPTSTLQQVFPGDNRCPGSPPVRVSKQPVGGSWYRIPSTQPFVSPFVVIWVFSSQRIQLFYYTEFCTTPPGRSGLLSMVFEGRGGLSCLDGPSWTTLPPGISRIPGYPASWDGPS